MTIQHTGQATILAAIAALFGSSLAYASPLDELNAELSKIGLPLAGTADFNAILNAHSKLTFLIDNPDGGSKTYTISDSLSLTRTFKAMQANDGFDAIHSTISNNSLVRDDGSNTTGECVGDSGGYTVSTWSGAITCLGLGEAKTNATTLNTLAVTTTTEFQFNAPAMQISNALDFMRGMRQPTSIGISFSPAIAPAPVTAPAIVPAAPGNTPVTPNMPNDPDVPANRPKKDKGGASSADQYLLFGNMGVYLSAGGSFGGLDNQEGKSGSSLSRNMVSVGLDFRYSDSIAIGILLNYVGSSAKLKTTFSKSENEIFRVAPYISITPFENAFIDMTIGYGHHQTLAYRPDTLGGLLNSEYGSHEAFASIGMGYSYSMKGVTITGYNRNAATGIVNDGYREYGTNAATAGVRINRAASVSVTTTLGTELNYAWSTPYGVVVPRLFGEWVHEHENDSRTIAGFIQGGGIPFAIQTLAPVRDWGNLGAGMQMVFPHALTGFINYQSLLMTGVDNHTVEGGVRWEF